MRFSQRGSWKRYTVHSVGFCDYIILARDTGVVESDFRTLGSCHIQPPCLRATRPPSSSILYVAPPRRNCLSPSSSRSTPTTTVLARNAASSILAHTVCRASPPNLPLTPPLHALHQRPSPIAPPLASALSSFSSGSVGCLSAPTHPGAHRRTSRARWRSSAKTILCPSAAISLDGLRRKWGDGM